MPKIPKKERLKVVIARKKGTKITKKKKLKRREEKGAKIIKKKRSKMTREIAVMPTDIYCLHKFSVISIARRKFKGYSYFKLHSRVPYFEALFKAPLLYLNYWRYKQDFPLLKKAQGSAPLVLI